MEVCSMRQRRRGIADTLGMFNTRPFSRIKRGAYFINIARGRSLLTQDLIGALQSASSCGRRPIRGCAGRQLRR